MGATNHIKKAILGSDADIVNTNFDRRAVLSIKGTVDVATAAGTYNIKDANGIDDLVIPANTRIISGYILCTEAFSVLTGTVTLGTSTASTTNIATNYSVSAIGSLSAFQTNVFTASGTHLKLTADTTPTYTIITAYSTGKLEIGFDLIQH